MTLKEQLIAEIEQTSDESLVQSVLDFFRFLKSQQGNLENTGKLLGQEPTDFIEKTYGICADDPIILDQEGIFEEGDELLNGILLESGKD